MTYLHWQKLRGVVGCCSKDAGGICNQAVNDKRLTRHLLRKNSLREFFLRVIHGEAEGVGSGVLRPGSVLGYLIHEGASGVPEKYFTKGAG